MIRQATYWKKDILANRDALARIAKQRMYGRETMVSIEKAVFITFYAIRKLLENGHFPEALGSYSVPVDESPRRVNGGDATDGPWDRLYDHDHSIATRLTLKKPCHQFVHSAVFVLHMSHPMQLRGFFFASDTTKPKKCYYISLEDMLDCFTRVAEE